eukprot:GHVS01107707.1.p1 GENE.GHVS01107707.1~~GHVS01107707.1.p1  ORF type:complete len:363 (+),score=84.44 GHVS01107707.1:63-1151(+)
MSSFFGNLRRRIEFTNSLLCVGIDPHPSDLPEHPTREDQAISYGCIPLPPPPLPFSSCPFCAEKTALFSFCWKLVTSTLPFASGYKPNIAFFERLGWRGLFVLERLALNVLHRSSSDDEGASPPPVWVIDCKRGDIGTTAVAYAECMFGLLQADAVTVNPYLGTEGIRPFSQWGMDEKKERKQRRAQVETDDDSLLDGPGVFVLCRTSNQHADEVQCYGTSTTDVSTSTTASDSSSGGVTSGGVTTATTNRGSSSDAALYLVVADMCDTMRAEEGCCIGIVVAANDIKALQQIRRRHPHLWFLSPGVGAQGASLEDAVAAGIRSDGLGLLLPISRGISQQPNPAEAAEMFRDRINAVRAKCA